MSVGVEEVQGEAAVVSCCSLALLMNPVGKRRLLLSIPDVMLAKSRLFCSVISFLPCLMEERTFLCCSPSSDLLLDKLALLFSIIFWT